MRSRTQNDIYISTNDFAKGIPIFFSSDGTVSTVSTDHFKQVCLGMIYIFRVRINKQIITGNLTKCLPIVIG